MLTSSSDPSTKPTEPKHVWYYDADDDVPMGQPGSSEPTAAATADNGI